MNKPPKCKQHHQQQIKKIATTKKKNDNCAYSDYHRITSVSTSISSILLRRFDWSMDGMLARLDDV